MKKDPRLYLELFLSTLKLSAFTFGGGYVIVPLMRKRFVEELEWIDEQEMLDLISISQSSPGPIAVNASLIIGYRMAGIPGALLTALGTILPPLLIISIISFFYEAFRTNTYVDYIMRGMHAGVAVVICNVVIDMSSTIFKAKNWLPILIMLTVFVAVYFFKVNILAVIFTCAIIGYVSGMIGAKKKKELEQQEEA